MADKKIWIKKTTRKNASHYTLLFIVLENIKASLNSKQKKMISMKEANRKQRNRKMAGIIEAGLILKLLQSHCWNLLLSMYLYWIQLDRAMSLKTNLFKHVVPIVVLWVVKSVVDVLRAQTMYYQQSVQTDGTQTYSDYT